MDNSYEKLKEALSESLAGLEDCCREIRNYLSGTDGRYSSDIARSVADYQSKFTIALADVGDSIFGLLAYFSDQSPFDTIHEDRIDLFEKRIECTKLTPKEIEVMRLVESGLSYQQMADKLSVSKKTVATHLCNIYEKLGMQGSNAKVRLAIYSAGHPNLIPENASVRLSVPRETAMSEREMQILEGLRERLSIDAIGKRLCISPQTITTYLTGIYKKIGLGERGSRKKAVLWYLKSTSRLPKPEVADDGKAGVSTNPERVYESVEPERDSTLLQDEICYQVHSATENFTRAESQVFEGISRGLNNRDISIAIGVSDREVESIASSVYRKIGMSKDFVGRE